MNRPLISRLANTGGPNSGKSSSFAQLIERSIEHKKIPIFTPEAATTLHEVGMFDGSRPSEEVQKYILLHQVRMEDHMLMTAESVANILEGYEPYLVCDRGIADQRAHIDYELFEKILKENGFPQGITDVFGRYDAVFHMETSPKEYYKLDNPARSEKTREEGMKRSKQFLDARVGHPHLRTIDNNYPNFQAKIDALCDKILHFLGVPYTYEHEDAYHVVDVDLKVFDEQGITIRESNIEQNYLLSDDPNTARRVRSRGWSDGARIYQYTEKYRDSDIEINKSLTQEEYETLLLERDLRFTTIKKKRYNFIWKNEYFELDYFLTGKFAGNRALEIEKMSPEQEVELPPFLNIKGKMPMRNIQMALQG